MTQNVAIIGAGIIGRLLAVKLCESGHKVTLYEKGDWVNPDACSYAAAGMIAPYCELETAEYLIARIGINSYHLWPKLVGELDKSLFYNNRGSIVVAHLNHLDELDHLKHRIARHPLKNEVNELRAADLKDVEPELEGHFQVALHYPLESALDNRTLLAALAQKILELPIEVRMNTEVMGLESGRIAACGDWYSYDLVIDCRGMGAKADLEGLRGVRGELLVVDAPDVELTRPIRFLHPRYPVYIVPHGNNRYFIGATAIESEDKGAITVQTTMELLSSAYMVHRGFAQARIVETITNLRPAFIDNIPRILYQEGLMRINGLYRHGFLMSPTIVQVVQDFLQGRKDSEYFGAIFQDIC